MFQPSCRLLRNLVLMVTAAMLMGCNKFEYHPYDGHISGATNLTAKNITKIESLCQGKDTICFAVISDTQRNYDETSDMVGMINGMDSVDFVINLGDITDFGETKEFLWSRDVMEKLRVPYVCLIGNHDCLGTGKHVYSKVFGKVNFAFTAGPTRFVCLNTNCREYDHTSAVPDFTFIRNQTDSFPSQAVNTVVAMHAPPGSEQFDNNVSEIFEEKVMEFPNLMFCLNGHTHHQKVEDMFGDGNLYYTCANAEKKSFLVFIVSATEYTFRVVETGS